jgi:hypothetical protein
MAPQLESDLLPRRTMRERDVVVPYAVEKMEFVPSE